jgi:ADP-ribose pyrophosphatase
MEKYRILVKGIVQYSDKFLIVEKWYDDRIVNPYQWEFIDGELEFGEKPDEAVIRIVQQKTGLTVYLNKILYTWTFMVGDVCNIGISYLCISVSDEISLSEDLNDFRWIYKDDFEDYIENQSILDDIKKAEL